MDKARLETSVWIGMVVIGLFLLAACQMSEPVSPTSDGAEILFSATSNVPISEAHRQKAQAASVARWEAMSQHYTELANAARELGAAADEARWNALGEQYQQEALEIERRAAASTARWTAMGAHYTADNNAAAEAYSARYEAMAEWYTR